MQGTEYCYVTVADAGSSAADLLAAELPKLLNSLAFSKSMRWQPHGDAAFSRPVRSLTALHGGDVVPFAFAGLAAGRAVRRARGEPEKVLEASGDYLSAMAAVGVAVDVAARRDTIWAGVCAAAAVRCRALCLLLRQL